MLGHSSGISLLHSRYHGAGEGLCHTSLSSFSHPISPKKPFLNRAKSGSISWYIPLVTYVVRQQTGRGGGVSRATVTADNTFALSRSSLLALPPTHLTIYQPCRTHQSQSTIVRRNSLQLCYGERWLTDVVPEGEMPQPDQNLLAGHFEGETAAHADVDHKVGDNSFIHGTPITLLL